MCLCALVVGCRTGSQPGYVVTLHTELLPCRPLPAGSTGSDRPVFADPPSARSTPTALVPSRQPNHAARGSGLELDQRRTPGLARRGPLVSDESLARSARDGSQERVDGVTIGEGEAPAEPPVPYRRRGSPGREASERSVTRPPDTVTRTVNHAISPGLRRDACITIDHQGRPPSLTPSRPGTARWRPQPVRPAAAPPRAP